MVWNFGSPVYERHENRYKVAHLNTLLKKASILRKQNIKKNKHRKKKQWVANLIKEWNNGC